MAHDPELIKDAQQHYSMGWDELTQVLPNQLEAIIDRGAWEGRERKDGDAFGSFYELATSPLWHGLGFTGEAKTLSYEDAVRYCKVRHPKIAQKLQAEAPAVAKTGRPEKGSQRPPLPKGSNNAVRLTARLKRHHPDIAERLAAGEFKSVRAAAIAAGIVTPPTPLDRLRTAWRKASADERQQFRSEIDDA